MRTLSLNERRLVELIYRTGQIARIDLTSPTGLTGASVTRLIAGLVEQQILKESILKDGARGQPKKLLSIKHEAFYSVGFYLLAERVEAVLVNFAGQVLRHRSIPAVELSTEQLVGIIHSTTHDLVKKSNISSHAFVGIGLGFPGNFSSSNHQLKAHKMFPKLDGHTIKQTLEQALDWDIYLENDGTAVALGEYLFGNHHVETLFLLHLGYGLGGGAVLNGRPYRGAHGNACLSGALFPYGQPRPTLQDFEENFSAIDRCGARPLAIDEDAIGREAMSRWIARASQQIEYAATLISGLYDPEVIVLGGALPSTILSQISQNLQKKIAGPSYDLQVAPVRTTTLGDLNGPIGAASIPFFEHFFPRPTEWI